MKNWSKHLLQDIAALLFGASLTLAFAPFEVFPLAAIAPTCLLALILNKTPSRALWLGYLFGIGYFGTGVYWVFISIHLYGDVPSYIAAFITAGLIAILAWYPALTSYFTNRFFPNKNNVQIIFAYPAIWVFSEWIRSWLFTGFPWLLLGYSQTNSPLRGYAPILGVYGVSLIVLLSGTLVLNAYLEFKQKKYQLLYINLFAVITIWIAGALFCLIPWTKPDGNAITVSLVQGNIPQSLKWSEDHIQLSFDRYAQLSEPLWGKTKLIIWPEAAIPMSVQNAAEFIQVMDEKAKKSGTNLVLGIPMQDAANDNFYNTVVTLGANHSTYLERHLVPFGQYIPFQFISSRIFDFMKIPISTLVPGKSVQPALKIGDLTIQTSICYEAAFPELVNTRNKEVNLLLTVTNDAWFGDSSAQAQHLQMGKMNAIALARPLLFVSNDGITAIIAPDGSILSAAPEHQTYVLNGTVQPMTGLTPWMFNGMDPILFIAILFIFVAKRSDSIRRQSANKQKSIINDSL